MPLGVHDTGLSIFAPSAPIDVYATGADDDVQINAAIAKAGAYGVVRLFGEFHWDDNPVDLDLEGITLDARGASCYYGGTGNAFRLPPFAADENRTKQKIYGLTLEAEGAAITSATATAIYIDSSSSRPTHMVYADSIQISEFNAGKGIVFNTTTATVDWIEDIVVGHLSLADVRIGVEFTGAGGGQSDVYIDYFWWRPADNTSANYGIKNSKTGAVPIHIVVGFFRAVTDTITNSTGIDYGAGTDWQIGQFIWDDNSTGNVSVVGTTLIHIDRANVASGSGNFFRDADIPWSSLERTLCATYGGKIRHITTAGWTAVVVGTGASAQDPGKIRVDTGTTANSSALLSAPASGLAKDNSLDNLDWTKPLYFKFFYVTRGADTEKVSRVQLKAASAIGALADQGIELLVTNVTPSLETYGSSGGTAASGVTLTNIDANEVVLCYLPGKAVQLYINGDLKCQNTVAAQIPSSLETTQSFYVHSVINGSTGTVEVYSYVIAPEVWQGD